MESDFLGLQLRTCLNPGREGLSVVGIIEDMVGWAESQKAVDARVDKAVWMRYTGTE